MKYCRKCGSQMSDDAKFCMQCGTAAAEPAAPKMTQQDWTQPEQNQWAPQTVKESFLANPIFLGVLYLVSGVLMLILSGLGGSMVNASEAAMYGDTYLAAVTAASSFISSMETLAFTAPALIAVATGIVLLQKRKGAYRAAIVGAIFQLIAAIMAVLIMVLVLVMPQAVISLYSYSPEVWSLGVQYLRSEGLSHCLMAELPIMVMGIAVFVLTWIARGKAKKLPGKAPLFGKMPRSAAALYVMIPFMAMLIFFKNILSTLLYSYMGVEVLAASSMVTNIINTYTLPMIYLAAIGMIYAVIAHKWKYWLVSVPGLGALLIYAIVVIVLIMSKGKALLYMNGTAASIAYANSMLLPHTIGNVLLAIALYCWIAATARGSIPAWLQVIISVVVMFGYIMLEFMFILGMNLGFSIPFGTLSISLLIIITAVLLGICCKPKKE